MAARPRIAAEVRAPRLLALLAALVLAGGPAAAAAPDDDRTEAMFRQWLPAQHAEFAAFETYLGQQQVLNVVPTWQLLRTASMWQACHAPPFQLPPRAEWPEAAKVLALLQELRRTQVLGPFSVVSAYRGEALNRCAGGSRNSAHMRFAVDIVPLAPGDDQKLCAFFRARGKGWDMGLSRYPSGRIHVDRTGFRTWGADYSARSSFCRQLAQKRP